jgi:hypothetical protein
LDVWNVWGLTFGFEVTIGLYILALTQKLENLETWKPINLKNWKLENP